MYVMYPEDSAHQYQLRAYVYLAKDMHSSDSSGLAGKMTLQNLSTFFTSCMIPMRSSAWSCVCVRADPYGKVSFANRSQATRVQKKTISPIWNQTVVLSDVVLFGDPESAHKFTPPVTVEFFDRDWIVSYNGSMHLYISRCVSMAPSQHVCRARTLIWEASRSYLMSV